MLNELAEFLQTPWVIMSLLAALGYASVGYIDEWLLRRHGKNGNGLKDDAAGKLIIISGLFGFVVSSVFLIFATVLGDFHTLWKGSWSITLAAGAGALEIIWLVPYFYAMQRAGALNATPLFQSIPVFSLLFGMLLFAEFPPAAQIGGAVLITVGAFLLNFDFKHRKIDWKTISLMLTSSALISLEYFLFKDAALQMGFVFSAFWSGVGMVSATVLIWTTWPPYRRQFRQYLMAVDRFDLGVQFTNEGINSASVLASQFAVTRGPTVMLVSAFNAFHPLFTLLIGGILSKFGSAYHAGELAGTRAAQKSLAIILIASGTATIALV